MVNIYLRHGGYVIVVVCLSVSHFAHLYPDRDTGKTALAEVCTVPVLLDNDVLG